MHTNLLKRRRIGAVAFAGALAVALVILLSSCVDVVSELRLGDDGSGTLTLRYTVAKALLNLGTTDEENRFYAFPISEEDFRDTVDAIDGLSLSSFDTAEEVDVVRVESELSFTSIDALSDFFGSSGPGAVELITDGDVTTFRHTLFEGTGAPPDVESARLIEAFFDGYEAAFSLRVPSEIVSVSAGAFDGKTASVDFAIPEVVTSEDAIVWEVSW
jgi:hypothetical protein